MSKQTSISLHLAKVMGLIDPFISVNLIRHGEKADRIFVPFDNRAQWADVLLWYVRCDAMIRLNHVSTRCPATSTEIDCDNNDESRMAATLEAIALATGWAG